MACVPNKAELIYGLVCISLSRTESVWAKTHDVNPPTTQPTPTPPSPPSGPMTRARAKALHDKVNSLLSTFDLGSTLDGMLLHTDTLCILRYEPPTATALTSAQGGAAEERMKTGAPGPEYSASTSRSLRPETGAPPRYRRSLRPSPHDPRQPRV